MNRFSCKYRIVKMLLPAALFLGASVVPVATAQAQTSVVSVKVLSPKGNYEWEGLVSDSVAHYNPELRSLLATLRQAQDKVVANENTQSMQKSKKGSDEALANLEKAKKMGLISDAEYQKMRKELLDSQQQMEAQAKANQSLPGVANPAALKEQIRRYCLGGRFYKQIHPMGNGVMRVTGTVHDGKPQEKTGLIDATGKMVIPMEYDRLDTPGKFGNEMLVEGKKRGKAGILTLKNEMVIPFIYDKIDFAADLPLLLCKKGGKWGASNRAAETIIPCVYNKLYRDGYKTPSGEKCTVLIGCDSNDKYGILNLSGSEVIPFHYIYMKGVRKENKIICVRTTSNGKVYDTYELCSWVKLEEGKPYTGE